MEITAVREPPANDQGVWGMFTALFRRRRPALARLVRNSNAYQQPLDAEVTDMGVTDDGYESGIIHSASHSASQATPHSASRSADNPSTKSEARSADRRLPSHRSGSTLDAALGRIHDIPQSAMSRLTGSPTVYAR